MFVEFLKILIVCISILIWSNTSYPARSKPVTGYSAWPDAELDIRPDTELDIRSDTELDIRPDTELDIRPDTWYEKAISTF